VLDEDHGVVIANGGLEKQKNRVAS
jgi:hypothetical protein